MSRRLAAAAALLAVPAAVALSFSAFWRRQPEQEDPTGTLPPEDYRALIEVVATYLALRNMRARFEDDDIVVEGPAGVGRYPVRGLVETCNGRQRRLWPQLVGQYFASPEDRGTPRWPEVGPRSEPPTEAAAPLPPVTRTPAPSPEPKPPAPPPEPRPPSRPPTMAERLAMATTPPPAGLRPLKAVRPVRPPEGPEEPVEFEAPVAPEEPEFSDEYDEPVAPDEPEFSDEYDEPVAPPVEPAPPRPAAPAAPSDPGAGGEAEAWAAFSAVVQDCFRRHGLTATVERESVLARDAYGRERRFEVPGLYRVTAELRRAQWPRFVDAVFGDLLLKSAASEAPSEAEFDDVREAPSEAEFDDMVEAPSEAEFDDVREAPSEAEFDDVVEAPSEAEFDDVREALAIQLFAADALSPGEREATIYSKDLPGLLSVLVCREGEQATRVAPGVVGGWGVGAEAVFVRALSNLAHLRPAARRVKLAPGVEGLCWEGESEFVAAQALLLGDDPRCSGRYGALVALPHRGLLVACPLRPMAGAGAAYQGAVAALIEGILASVREGQEMLSRRLYWYHDGAFTDLPYSVEMAGGEPTVDFRPPATFVAILSALGGDAPTA